MKEATYEQSSYSVEYKLNSLNHDFVTTLRIAYWFSTDSNFGKTCSQQFSDKEICLVEDTNRKSEK